MNYEMEELLPVVGRLAEKYTAFESTSVTYEKAEQLMGAVLYCIQEIEPPETEALAPAKSIPAQQAYEMGIACVEKKAKEALEMYNKILPDFHWYGNCCLYDTFVTELPEFFKWYDIRFEPQNTILTLDYPVLKDISRYTGVDKIYQYIHCIYLEQNFLHKFSEADVTKILSNYHKEYQELAENICEIVLQSVIWHILAGKQFLAQDFLEEDFTRIQEILRQSTREDLIGKLVYNLQSFLHQYFDDTEELAKYLTEAVPGIIIRMKAAGRVDLPV